MTVIAESRVVLSSLQMLVAEVAVALCSDAEELDLGEWEPRRVPLGEQFGCLAHRLAAARDLENRSGAVATSALDADGQSVLAVELMLRTREISTLMVAAERMRGIVAATGEFGEIVAAELEHIMRALP
jgi:hypothetical protein